MLNTGMFKSTKFQMKQFASQTKNKIKDGSDDKFKLENNNESLCLAIYKSGYKVLIFSSR